MCPDVIEETRTIGLTVIMGAPRTMIVNVVIIIIEIVVIWTYISIIVIIITSILIEISRKIRINNGRIMRGWI